MSGRPPFGFRGLAGRLVPEEPEAAVVRNYLDWLTALPWTKKTKDRLDVKLAEKILEEDHYGLKKPKERILEIYLSWAEWGKGVFGIEAAARKFYGKSLARLDLDQTARLVALLSSPIRYTPETLHKNGILRTRYQYLMGKYGAVDGEQ